MLDKELPITVRACLATQTIQSVGSDRVLPSIDAANNYSPADSLASSSGPQLRT